MCWLPGTSAAATMRCGCSCRDHWSWTQPLPPILRPTHPPPTAYGLLALLMLLIHVFSPDPDVSAFPSSCPRGKSLGCSRIAEQGAHHARHLKPLHLNTTLAAASAATAAWVEQQSQPRILRRRDDFIHARFLTVFWGFADDFFVGLRWEWLGPVMIS